MMRRTVAEHQQAVLEVLACAWQGGPGAPVRHGAETRIPLADAPGRVLAAELVAPLDLPPFDNSQMDGFAIWADPAKKHPKDVDSAKSTVYPIVATIPAGVLPQPLESGTAAPIMARAAVSSSAWSAP